MDKKQREERRRQEDAALNRGLAWVGAAIVLELLLLLVNKYYINVYTTTQSIAIAMAIHSVLKAVRIIFLAGLVLCLGWSGMNGKKEGRGALPGILLLACLALFFTSHLILSFNAAAVRMLLMLVPAWAGLALVFYLYQREFFFSAFLGGLGVVAIWLIRHQAGSRVTVYAFLAVLALLLLLAAALLLRAKQNGGELTLAGRSIRLLPHEAGYGPIFITAAVIAVAVALALALGATIAYYLIYALVAWLFGLLVYYTVKLM